MSTPWTKDEEIRLRQGWVEGRNPKGLQQCCPNRTVKAITEKLPRIGCRIRDPKKFPSFIGVNITEEMRHELRSQAAYGGITESALLRHAIANCLKLSYLNPPRVTKARQQYLREYHIKRKAKKLLERYAAENAAPKL